MIGQYDFDQYYKVKGINLFYNNEYIITNGFSFSIVFLIKAQNLKDKLNEDHMKNLKKNSPDILIQD